MTSSTMVLDHIFGGSSAHETLEAEALNSRGMACFERGDLGGALTAFCAAARRQPNYAEAWNNCGIARQALGRTAEALDDFNEALTLQPVYAEALNNRARARQRLGDVAGAHADFDRALACVTDQFAATIHHNRGALRQAAGDLAGALADYDRALAIDPDHAATYVNRAQARKDANDLPGALADCERALALTPHTRAAQILHQRGGVRALLNDFAGAVADYDEALRLEPAFGIAYISRGSACYHLRRDRQGVLDYFTAFRLDLEGSARELVRVLAEGVRRDGKEVLDNCDQHLRINPRDILAHGRRGLTLVLLGREEEAAPHLAQFRATVRDVGPYLDRLVELARESRLPTL